MANVQLENGYTRVANAILDALSCTDLSGSAWRCAVFIIRKTYGFKKKHDPISLSQFELGTQLTRMSVTRGIGELVKKNIISKTKSGYICVYTFNKDYDTWGSIKLVTSNKNDTRTSIKPVTRTSNKNDTHKRKKENKYILAATAAKIDMGIRKYNENEHYEEDAIDGETREPVGREDLTRKAIERELNDKIKHNIRLTEEMRGMPYGSGKDIQYHVSIYRRLLDRGWAHETIVGTLIELINSPYWKDKRELGEYPGMNTVEAYLRNRKPK